MVPSGTPAWLGRPGPAGPAQLAQAGDVNLPACTSAFDALWFCYSPPNQMKKYYREGTYDDCEAHRRDHAPVVDARALVPAW